MSGYRVQCAGCGYLTQVADIPCPRCGTLLSLGQIVGDADEGATIYSGEESTNAFGWDQTEAFGSLPSVTPLPPLPSPPSLPQSQVEENPELPAISIPSQPAVAISGNWDAPPPAVEDLLIPVAMDPRAFQPPAAGSLQEPHEQPWTMEAPPAPPPPQAPHPAYAPSPPNRVAPPHHTSFGPPVTRAAPPKRRIPPALLIGITAAGIAAIGLGVLFAAVWSSGGGRPSTEETRKKYAAALAKQPDFVANLEGMENGAPIKSRYASLNGERLIEVPLPKSMFLDMAASGATLVTVIFQQDDKVTAIAHEFWVYRTVPKSSLGTLASSSDPFGEMGRIAGLKTTTITEAGSEKVGEYDTTILLLSETGSEPIQLNVAPALNNLIVRLDVPAGASKLQVPIRYTLSNVSMTVDPELFRVPTSYNQLKAP